MIWILLEGWKKGASYLIDKAEWGTELARADTDFMRKSRDIDDLQMEVISHQVTVEVAKETCDDVTRALKIWQEAARDFYGARPPDMFALIGLTQLVGAEQNVPENLNYILVIAGI